jgi:hypothetical protein
MDTQAPSKTQVLPTISLNGTSRNTLLDDTSDALNALRDALRALAITTPNTRDYPNPGDIGLAMAQHLERKRRIESVITELETLAEHIVG